MNTEKWSIFSCGVVVTPTSSCQYWVLKHFFFLTKVPWVQGSMSSEVNKYQGITVFDFSLKCHQKYFPRLNKIVAKNKLNTIVFGSGLQLPYLSPPFISIHASKILCFNHWIKLAYFGFPLKVWFNDNSHSIISMGLFTLDRCHISYI